MCSFLSSSVLVLCRSCFRLLAGVSFVGVLRGRRRLVCCGGSGRLVVSFVPRGGRRRVACFVLRLRFLLFLGSVFAGLRLGLLSCVFVVRRSAVGGCRLLCRLCRCFVGRRSCPPSSRVCLFALLGVFFLERNEQDNWGENPPNPPKKKPQTGRKKFPIRGNTIKTKRLQEFSHLQEQDEKFCDNLPTDYAEHH